MKKLKIYLDTSIINFLFAIDVKIINEKEGYFYPLILTNPMEVLYEDN